MTHGPAVDAEHDGVNDGDPAQWTGHALVHAPEGFVLDDGREAVVGALVKGRGGTLCL